MFPNTLRARASEDVPYRVDLLEAARPGNRLHHRPTWRGSNLEIHGLHDFGTVGVLEVDPDLGRGLSRGELLAAKAALRAPTHLLPPGIWSIPDARYDRDTRFPRTSSL
jgi:hypothetical protein